MEKMGLKSFSTGPWIMDMDVNGCLPTEIEFNSPCLDRVILVQRYGTVSVAPNFPYPLGIDMENHGKSASFNKSLGHVCRYVQFSRSRRNLIDLGSLKLKTSMLVPAILDPDPAVHQLSTTISGSRVSPGESYYDTTINHQSSSYRFFLS